MYTCKYKSYHIWLYLVSKRILN